MASAYRSVRRLEVAARPVREPQERRAAPRPRWSSSPTSSSARRAWRHGAGDVAEEPGQPGAVDRDRGRAACGTPPRRRRPSPADRSPVAVRRPAVASSQRSASRRRASTPSSLASSPGSTRRSALLSTGRVRITSSGSASSHRRSGRLLSIAGSHRRDRELDQVGGSREVARPPARGGSPRRRSPFCSYHSLARRCSSGDALGLLVEQARRSTSAKRWW